MTQFYLLCGAKDIECEVDERRVHFVFLPGL